VSIRYTGMYVPSGGITTIIFTTKAIQITGVAFQVNVQKITLSTANLNITGVGFTVTLGAINYDNGFMIF